MAGPPAPVSSFSEHAESARARFNIIHKMGSAIFGSRTPAKELKSKELVDESDSSESHSDSDRSDVGDTRKDREAKPSKLTTTPTPKSTINGAAAKLASGSAEKERAKVAPTSRPEKEAYKSVKREPSGSDSDSSSTSGSASRPDAQASQKKKLSLPRSTNRRGKGGAKLTLKEEASQSESESDTSGSGSDSESDSSSDNDSEASDSRDSDVRAKTAAKKASSDSGSESGSSSGSDSETSEDSSSRSEEEAPAKSRQGMKMAPVEKAKLKVDSKGDTTTSSSSEDEGETSDESTGIEHDSDSTSDGEGSGSSSDEEGSDREETAQSGALTRADDKEASHVPEMIRPDFYLRKVDQNLAADDVAGILKRARLENKQIWYFSAPASLPITVLEDLEINAENAGKGLPILTHDGANYGLTFDEPNAVNHIKVLIPLKHGNKYGLLDRRVNQVMHVKRITQLPTDETRSQGLIEAAPGNKKAPRPQPKGLKARYRPLGVTKGSMGKIGMDASSDSDSDVDMPLAPPAPEASRPAAGSSLESPAETPKGSRTKKRKHKDDESGDGEIDSAKKSESARLKKPRVEKDGARTQLKEPATSHKQTPIAPPVMNGGVRLHGASSVTPVPRPATGGAASQSLSSTRPRSSSDSVPVAKLQPAKSRVSAVPLPAGYTGKPPLSSSRASSHSELKQTPSPGAGVDPSGSSKPSPAKESKKKTVSWGEISQPAPQPTDSASPAKQPKAKKVSKQKTVSSTSPEAPEPKAAARPRPSKVTPVRPPVVPGMR